MLDAVRTLAILILSASALAPAIRAQEPNPLEREKILQAYKGGDLDSVLVYIKTGRAKPVFRDREDSLLAFKCLGVIYASDKARREKGRYFFNMLLWLDPKATITEFYPGETVRQVFREVRDEYFELHPEAAQNLPPSQDVVSVPDAETSKKPDSVETAVDKPRKSSRMWWWVGSGTVLTAAAGTAVYYVWFMPPKVYNVND